MACVYVSNACDLVVGPAAVPGRPPRAMQSAHTAKSNAKDHTRRTRLTRTVTQRQTEARDVNRRRNKCQTNAWTPKLMSGKLEVKCKNRSQKPSTYIRPVPSLPAANRLTAAYPTSIRDIADA
eukprot:3941538-Rhodomonas_salina.7